MVRYWVIDIDVVISWIIWCDIIWLFIFKNVVDVLIGCGVGYMIVLNVMNSYCNSCMKYVSDGSVNIFVSF